MQGHPIVVTGAAGYIGAALVRDLLRDARSVHALVHPRTDDARLRSLEGADRLVVHRADLCDLAATQAALAGLGPVQVVHTAAPGGHAATPEELVQLWRDAVLGTVGLLAALAGVEVAQLVHLGSSTEYRPSGRPLRETDPTEPSTARGAAKLAATLAVQQWAASTATPSVVLRIFRAYGPDEQPGRLLHEIARCLAAGDALPIPSGPTRRDWVHVDDVVGAIRRCLDVGTAVGEVCNVGSGVERSVDEVVAMVAEVRGTPLRVERGARPRHVHDVEHWVADLAHTEATLGWRPSIELRAGLRAIFAGADAVRR